MKNMSDEETKVEEEKAEAETTPEEKIEEAA